MSIYVDEAIGAMTARGRGRPPGGGNPPEHARELLLDAAERSFARRGYRSSTMQVIAREAGYTRAVIYRHFATRDELLDALVVRVAVRRMTAIATRMPITDDPGVLVVESLVIVATEVGQDPLLRVISEHTDDGNVAALIARSATLGEVLAGQFEAGFDRAGGYLRAGLRTGDAARFVLSVALGLLLGLIPGIDDDDQVRRYVRVFVLPALAAEPPPAGPVFAPLD